MKLRLRGREKISVLLRRPLPDVCGVTGTPETLRRIPRYVSGFVHPRSLQPFRQGYASRRTAIFSRPLLRRLVFLCCISGLGAFSCQPVGPSELPTGYPCEWSGQCRGGICLAAETAAGAATGWTDGLCSAPCPERACDGAAEVCVDLAEGGRCLPACGADPPCRAGYVCAADIGACLPDCRGGFDCGVGRECGTGGLCGWPAATGAVLGAACATSADCLSALCLPATAADGNATGWDGGMCVTPCPAGPCPDGATCARLGAERYCLPACAAADICRTGYVCSAALGVCLPDCRAGWDCGAGYACDAAGQCVVASDPGLPLGSPCAAAADCASGICFAAEVAGAATGWAGGLCVAPAEAGQCPEGTVPARLADGLWCVPRCAAALPCRAGYVCNAEFGGCLPDCRAGFTCGSGYACDAAGQCVVESDPGLGLGSPCTAAADCASGICFAAEVAGAATGWAGGMCVAPAEAGQCPANTVPARLDAGLWCVPVCAGALPCRAGYVCSADVGGCLPDCRAGFACAAGFVCGDDGRCSPDEPVLAPLGAPCTATTDCASGVCLAAESAGAPTGWTDGLCAEYCTNWTCPLEAACAVLSGHALCLPACAADGDCRPGYVCAAEFGVCLPDCNGGFACGPGLECGPDGHCTPPVVPVDKLGAPCTHGFSCESGFCIPETSAGAPTGWPGGTCSLPCASTDDCPAGSSCTALSGRGYCLADCRAAADCRAGYVCNSTAAVCLPHCATEGFSCGAFVCRVDGQCSGPPSTLPASGAAR